MRVAKVAILSILTCLAAAACCEVGKALWRAVVGLEPDLLAVADALSLAAVAAVCGFALAILAVLTAIEVAGEEGPEEESVVAFSCAPPR